MKEYVKPIILLNEEIAEGVYAASGDTCWTVSQRGDVVHSYEGRKVFFIDLTHDGSAHDSAGAKVTFTFNFNVSHAFCGGSTAECNGNVVTAVYSMEVIENYASTNLFVNVLPEDDISSISPEIVSLSVECI